MGETGLLKTGAGRASALAIVALLGGCATRTVPPHLAALPTPATVATRPLPPAGASPTQTTPPHDADGHYRTINSDLSPEATVWHLRSALNVAALGCRGPRESALIAQYNQLLSDKRALLAAAFARTEAESRTTGGKDWRDRHDRQMTQLYNFFAQPPAKEGFCAAAADVAAEAAVIPAAQFTAYAGPALARLEAPFTDFYRAYDQYRRDLAAWQANASAGPQLSYASVETLIAFAPTRSDRRLASADR